MKLKHFDENNNNNIVGEMKLNKLDVPVMIGKDS